MTESLDNSSKLAQQETNGQDLSNAQCLIEKLEAATAGGGEPPPENPNDGTLSREDFNTVKHYIILLEEAIHLLDNSESKSWDWNCAMLKAQEAAEDILADSNQNKYDLVRAWVTEAAALNKLEEFNEAATILRKTLRYPQVQLDTKIDTELYAYGITLRHLAEARYGQVRLAEAEALARRALEILRGFESGFESWDKARITEQIGKSERALKRILEGHAKAQAIENEADTTDEKGKTEKPWP